MPTGETFPFTCTQCGHSTTFPIAQFGRMVTCPSCRADQVVGGTGRIEVERIATGAIRRADPAVATGSIQRRPGTSPIPTTTPVPSPVPATGSGRLEFVCNSCDHRVVIHASLSGQPVRCAKCGAVQLAGVAGVRVARLDAQGRLPFACGLCGFSTRLAADYAGKAIKCPKCRAPQVVPKLIKDGTTGISGRRTLTGPTPAPAPASPPPALPTPLPGIPPTTKPPTTLCPTSERPTVSAPPAAMPERLPSAALTPSPPHPAGANRDAGAMPLEDPFEAATSPSGRVVRRRSLVRAGDDAALQAPTADPLPMMPGEATGSRPIDAPPPTSALFLSSQAPAYLRLALIGGACLLLIGAIACLALWRTTVNHLNVSEALLQQTESELADTRAKLEACEIARAKAETERDRAQADLAPLKTEIEGLKDENAVLLEAQRGWGERK